MLFNSNFFIFVFLPVSLIGYYFFGALHRLVASCWLILCSLAFYAWWNPPFVLVLLGSATTNCLFAHTICARSSRPRQQAAILWFAITANLGLLFYFKYLFTLNVFLRSLGAPLHAMDNVVLPLGISFFTFTQLGYLVDCKQGLVRERGVINYFLFVTFFPHLIAGPILHNREIMPQFAQGDTYRFKQDNLSVGLTLFVMGLAKKVLIADRLADAADAGFADPGSLALFGAWGTALAYSLQLYFDFSGYSDMALGLARMFGVRFPLNFNSPYKAASIIDFWQRWHMTLTRYLTLYLYNPVAMYVTRRRAAKGYRISRQAAASPGGFASLIMLPTFFTMILAGVWHGAGFQFLIFGLLHACYLTINHAWRLLKAGGPKHAPPSPLQTAFYVLLTYVAVLVAQVFFRAGSSGSALTLLSGMIGGHGVERGLPLSAAAIARLGDAGRIVAGHGMAMTGMLGLIVFLCQLTVLFAVAWFMPNTQQILARFSPALEAVKPAISILQWRPAPGYAVAMGLVFWVCVIALRSPTRFLYFQF